MKKLNTSIVLLGLLKSNEYAVNAIQLRQQNSIYGRLKEHNYESELVRNRDKDEYDDVVNESYNDIYGNKHQREEDDIDY